MFRFRKGLIVVAAVLSSSFAVGQSASAAVSWEFSEESVALGISAVSPHVERTGSADRIWYQVFPLLLSRTAPMRGLAHWWAA